MPIDDLDPVALAAFLLSHATLAKLEAKGLLTLEEAKEVIARAEYASKCIADDVAPDKAERMRAANSVLKLLVGRAGWEKVAP